MNTLKRMAILLTVLAAGFFVQTLPDLPEAQPALSAALRFGML